MPKPSAKLMVKPMPFTIPNAVPATPAPNAEIFRPNHADAITAELFGVGQEKMTSYMTGGVEYAGGVRSLTVATGDHAEPTDARASMIVLGLVLGALEARTPKEAWRSSHGYGRAMGSPEYLRFLAGQGYALAPVEEIITGDRKADEVFDEWLAEQES